MTDFLKEIVDSVSKDKYIHLGMDEVITLNIHTIVNFVRFINPMFNGIGILCLLGIFPSYR